MKEPMNGERSSAVELQLLRASGFTDEEVCCLLVGRERFQNGLYSDETQESKRLWFAKWLYEHCQVNDGYCGKEQESAGQPATLEKKRRLPEPEAACVPQTPPLR